MADKQNKEEQKGEKEPKLKVKNYEKIIDRLKKERNQLRDELNRDYKEARRFVRSHPEEGVLMGFAGGVVVGLLIGRLLK